MRSDFEVTMEFWNKIIKEKYFCKLFSLSKIEAWLKWNLNSNDIGVEGVNCFTLFTTIVESF